MLSNYWISVRLNSFLCFLQCFCLITSAVIMRRSVLWLSLLITQLASLVACTVYDYRLHTFKLILLFHRELAVNVLT